MAIKSRGAPRRALVAAVSPQHFEGHQNLGDVGLPPFSGAPTRPCHFVDRARPRDVLAALRNARSAQRIMGGRRWSRVISTGSVMAVPFFVVARANGIACHYIESVARVAGPSLTGRLLEWVSGVHRYANTRAGPIGEPGVQFGLRTRSFRPHRTFRPAHHRPSSTCGRDTRIELL